MLFEESLKIIMTLFPYSDRVKLKLAKCQRRKGLEVRLTISTGTNLKDGNFFLLLFCSKIPINFETKNRSGTKFLTYFVSCES